MTLSSEQIGIALVMWAVSLYFAKLIGQHCGRQEGIKEGRKQGEKEVYRKIHDQSF